MERLTERERNVDGTGVAKEEITDGLLKPFADKILTKLAVYEDLEEGNELICAKKAKRANRARPVSEILLMMFRSANRDYRKTVKKLEEMKK